MRGKRVQAVVLATAVVAGYGGAAAYSAWAQPPVETPTDFGPDDGLARYVLTASAAGVTPELLAALEATPGVPSAQEVGDGRALVATHRLVPAQLEAVPGVVDAEPSVSVPVLGSPSDRLDRAGHHPAR